MEAHPVLQRAFGSPRPGSASIAEERWSRWNSRRHRRSRRCRIRFRVFGAGAPLGLRACTANCTLAPRTRRENAAHPCPQCPAQSQLRWALAHYSRKQRTRLRGLEHRWAERPVWVRVPRPPLSPRRSHETHDSRPPPGLCRVTLEALLAGPRVCKMSRFAPLDVVNRPC